MILDFIEGPLDGDSWEALCDSCYRMRYQEQNYQKVQAVLGGDAGIEGYTKTGIVYQCYCPERQYTDDELYNHLRNKMTKDIDKLVNPEYIKRLKNLGIREVREWHFLIPQYKDPRILQHAETKRKEVLKLKLNNPIQYDYISSDFEIIVKVAEDFKVELTRIIRTTLSDVKLNLAFYHDGEVDWEKCDSEKVSNIKRKVKAVMNITEEDIEEDIEEYKEVVDIYIEAYIKGIEILKTLRVSYTEIYEDIYRLEQAYKREVSIRTKMNMDSSINSKIFNDIMDNFENKLKESFSAYLSLASIMELKVDLISGWLADCSMQFKSR